MCGIAGIFAPGGRADPQTVRLMTDAMWHRGPDDEGIEVVAGGQVALGHRRLSILDLSPLGHQPMMHPSGRLWVTFNGEIYNFREIRTELETAGEQFRSESDTEVILASYHRWGRECLHRFRGMFALALWDANIDALILVRDRFGVKPLHYRVSGGQLSFASEIRGLLAGPGAAASTNVCAAAEFLRYGYISAPQSVFAEVASVPPGCTVVIDRNLQPSVERYWQASDLFVSNPADELRRELASLDEESLLDRFEQALIESFELRMVSDVPVGLFLSGGIDSTVVATLLARRSGLRLRTFTIGYADARFNEIPFARAIADELGTEHTELEVSEAHALEITDRLLSSVDEPIGDSSIIPTHIVCELARKSVKVALSADGGDELLGGYPRYEVCGRFVQSMGGWMRFAYLAGAEVLDMMPPQLIRALYRIARRGGPGYAAIDDKVRKFVRMAKSSSALGAYDAGVSEFSDNELRRLLGNGSEKGTAQPPVRTSSVCRDPREGFMLTDIQHYLPGDLLTKLDRTSMAVSLEAREPFLDHRLAALAAALPMRWKIRNGQGKYILRRILARHLRSDFFNRPKQGFSAPISTWLRRGLSTRVHEILSASNVRRSGLLDAHAVTATLERFMNGSGISAAGLWHVLQLQGWAAKWTPPNRISTP
jgi:asparagine synthase (glutamine-hydrolysing)